MEIIKKGRVPSLQEYRATCSNCHTEFKFKQYEGKITDDQRDGRFISVHCPMPGCMQRVDVSL
jgi:hypothetical protein